MELLILLAIALFVFSYRNKSGESVYKFIKTQASDVYDKVAPYSFKEVQEKTKGLKGAVSSKDMIFKVVLFGVAGGGIAYLYFYSIVWTIVYASVAIAFIPYLSYLQSHRVYSEFIFEQIQVYTSNVIMEFNTTQAFVKSLEGVRDSGILEDPVLSDLKTMIQMSYDNGTIEPSIEYFNKKYDFYMVKNMHQLFMQITKEGAKDAGESLENMAMDIDMLVEGVYRDQMDRTAFHRKFVIYGISLFLLVLAMQLLLGTENYLALLNMWYIQLVLHAIICINCYFLISGEKYYNEDVGGE